MPPPPGVERGTRWPRGWRIAAWTAVGVAALVLAGTDVAYRVLVLQASELARAGQLDAARGLYERVLTINPHAAEAVDGLAYDALRAGNVNIALARWERSIRLNPTSAYARVGIGETYLRLGRVDDAIAQLEKATELAPGQPSSFLLLAAAYEAKGDGTQASVMRTRANDVAAQQSAVASGPRLLY
jgi:tetratricopeptide (TPR) repeat protein